MPQMLEAEGRRPWEEQASDPAGLSTQRLALRPSPAPLATLASRSCQLLDAAPVDDEWRTARVSVSGVPGRRVDRVWLFLRNGVDGRE